jgi:enoyl-CoA hydratase/carnithine racemase
VLLMATGDVFLSGGDLNALRGLPDDARGAHAVIGLGERLAAIERCSVPVIAAVGGPVYGGGCELLVMTDIVVMDEQAKMHFVHRKMGLVPAWGGCTRLTERVGAARAADILLTARPVSAAEAVEIGLASRIAPQGTAEPAAEAIAEELARSPREALVAIKRSLLATRLAARADSIERERKSFRSAWGSPAHKASMDRFLKR